MLHIDQSFKCEYSSSNFNFIVSFQHREIYVVVFTSAFEWDNTSFPAYDVKMLFQRHVHAIRIIKCQVRV